MTHTWQHILQAAGSGGTATPTPAPGGSSPNTLFGQTVKVGDKWYTLSRTSILKGTGFKKKYITKLVLKEVGRNAQRSFVPGLYVTATGQIVDVDGTGLILRGRTLDQGEREAAGVALGGTGLGTGEPARNYAAEQAAADAAQAAREADQRAWQQEQNRLEREAAAELQRLQEENAMKRTRLGEAGSLARTAAEVQQRARQLIADLTGVDPIRGAVAAQGGVQRGTTPAQGFNTQLQGIANAPIPQVNESMNIPQIEQTIGALQGQQQLPVAPSLGFARGGTIDMHRGADGSFSARSKYAGDAPDDENSGGDYGFSADQPSTKRAVLTGERNFDGDEEVVVMDMARPGRVEIIPLIAGAQQGGSFDVGSIRAALAPIYGSMGFQGDVPTAGRLPGGSFIMGPQRFGGGLIGGPGTAFNLGYRPRLIRNIETGAIGYVDAQGRQMGIGSMADFNRFGFQQSDVMNIAPGEGSLFGPPGGLLRERPQIEQSVRRYPTRATPLITPPEAGSIALPDPRMLAGIWRFLDPSTRNVLISAYGVAGLGTPEQALREIEESTRFFTPTGTQTRAGSARFG